MPKNIFGYIILIITISWGCTETTNPKNIATKYFDVKTTNDTFKILYATNCPALNFQSMNFLLATNKNAADTLYNDSDIILTKPQNYLLIDSLCDNLSDSIKIAMIKELIFVHLQSTASYHYKNPFSDGMEVISSKAVAVKYIDYIYWGKDIAIHTDIYPNGNILPSYSFEAYQQFYQKLYTLANIADAQKNGLYPPK
jgi:hypothetical protein